MSAAQEIPDFTAAYESLLPGSWRMLRQLFPQSGALIHAASINADQWRALDELRKADDTPMPEAILRMSTGTGASSMMSDSMLELLLGDFRCARRFVCDCAERVLHVYESAHPNNKRPRKAINAARAYCDDPTPENAKRMESAWKHVRNTANAAMFRGRPSISPQEVTADAKAADAAKWAAAAIGIGEGARAASFTAHHLGTGTEENAWQIDHLVACVRAMEAGAPWPKVSIDDQPSTSKAAP